MAETTLFDGDQYKVARPVLPTLAIATERILDAHSRATDPQIEEGLHWYETANELATDMYLAYPDRLRTVAHGAGLLAALSPNESWDNNVANAWMFLKYDTSRSLPRSIDDARLICAGFTPEHVLFRDGVNFKVQSFYQNIYDPTDPFPVTVDRHAKGIIYNDALVVKAKPHATRNDYDHYAEAYRQAAKKVDVLPSQMQAITWLAWRNVPTKSADISEQIAWNPFG
jgi:hypothetical protein